MIEQIFFFPSCCHLAIWKIAFIINFDQKVKNDDIDENKFSLFWYKEKAVK